MMKIFSRIYTCRLATFRCWRVRLRSGALLAGVLAGSAAAQQTFTWEQVREKFQATNPTLQAALSSIDESRASEITAYLRPNPEFTMTADGTQLTSHLGIYRPFAGTDLSPAFSYLHEREHKRELRRDTARESTEIAESDYADQARTSALQPAQRLRADVTGQSGARKMRKRIWNIGTASWT